MFLKIFPLNWGRIIKIEDWLQHCITRHSVEQTYYYHIFLWLLELNTNYLRSVFFDFTEWGFQPPIYNVYIKVCFCLSLNKIKLNEWIKIKQRLSQIIGGKHSTRWENELRNSKAWESVIIYPWLEYCSKNCLDF